MGWGNAMVGACLLVTLSLAACSEGATETRSDHGNSVAADTSTAVRPGVLREVRAARKTEEQLRQERERLDAEDKARALIAKRRAEDEAYRAAREYQATLAVLRDRQASAEVDAAIERQAALSVWIPLNEAVARFTQGREVPSGLTRARWEDLLRSKLRARRTDTRLLIASGWGVTDARVEVLRRYTERLPRLLQEGRCRAWAREGDRESDRARRIMACAQVRRSGQDVQSRVGRSDSRRAEVERLLGKGWTEDRVARRLAALDPFCGTGELERLQQEKAGLAPEGPEPGRQNRKAMAGANRASAVRFARSHRPQLGLSQDAWIRYLASRLNELDARADVEALKAWGWSGVRARQEVLRWLSGPTPSRELAALRLLLLQSVPELESSRATDGANHGAELMRRVRALGPEAQRTARTLRRRGWSARGLLSVVESPAIELRARRAERAHQDAREFD